VESETQTFLRFEEGVLRTRRSNAVPGAADRAQLWLRPDKRIFVGEARPPFRSVARGLANLAAVRPGLRFDLREEATGRRVLLAYPDGLSGWLEELCDAPWRPDPRSTTLTFREHGPHGTVDIALRLASRDEPSRFFGFADGRYSIWSAHLDGLLQGLRDALGTLMGELERNADWAALGLLAVVHVEHWNPDSISRGPCRNQVLCEATEQLVRGVTRRQLLSRFERDEALAELVRSHLLGMHGFDEDDES